MAKQIGGIIIKGRLAGLSYYKSKRSKYAIVRTIDPNASERAKHDPNYSVFRTYGKEFGMLGQFSGVVVSKLPSREKSILKPYRVADLTKLLLQYLATDLAHPLGQRDLMDTEFRDALTEKINWLSKIDQQNFFGPLFEFVVAPNLSGQPSSVRVTIQENDEIIYKMNSLGIDGVDFAANGIEALVPFYRPETGEYQKSAAAFYPIANNTWTVNAGQGFGMSGAAGYLGSRRAWYYIAVCTARPYRLIGGQKNYLENYASISARYVYQIPE